MSFFLIRLSALRSSAAQSTVACCPDPAESLMVESDPELFTAVACVELTAVTTIHPKNSNPITKTVSPDNKTIFFPGSAFCGAARTVSYLVPQNRQDEKLVKSVSLHFGQRLLVDSPGMISNSSANSWRRFVYRARSGPCLWRVENNRSSLAKI